MRFVLPMLAAFAASGAALAQSGTEVRRVRPLPVPPELAGEYRPGDRWGRVELDVDRRGAVTGCRVIETNEPNRARRFHMCRAFLLDYEIEPIVENGVAVPGKIRRLFLLQRRNRRRPANPG